MTLPGPNLKKMLTNSSGCNSAKAPKRKFRTFSPAISIHQAKSSSSLYTESPGPVHRHPREGWWVTWKMDECFAPLASSGGRVVPFFLRPTCYQYPKAIHLYTCYPNILSSEGCLVYNWPDMARLRIPKCASHPERNSGNKCQQLFYLHHRLWTNLGPGQYLYCPQIKPKYHSCNPPWVIWGYRTPWYTIWVCNGPWKYKIWPISHQQSHEIQGYLSNFRPFDRHPPSTSEILSWNELYP